MIPQQAAHLVEMFSSVQGEGVYVGASTLFVRFAECDLRCRWCDTPHSWMRGPVARLEIERGSAEFREVANPVTQAELIEAAEGLQLASHRFVSFTGGEPLLQPEPLAALARAFRARGPRTHLETHGLHTAALEQVLPEIDVVSMDWKLASDVRRASDPKSGAIDDYHAAHAEFLRLALAAPEVMVKVVITESSRDDEIDEMIAQLVGVSPEVMVIVQPVTPCGGIATAPSARRLLDLTQRIEQQLPNVRLIPQTHRLYGAL